MAYIITCPKCGESYTRNKGPQDLHVCKTDAQTGFERIQAYERLKEQEEAINMPQRIRELQAELDAKDKALHEIDNWCKAYPVEVFPKPDLKKAAKVLKAANMTLGSITADSMRHVTNGIKEILDQALKGTKDE